MDLVEREPYNPGVYLMRIILTQDVRKLGAIGDIVNVKDGYARNYLLPRNFAVAANESNKAELDHQKRVLERKSAKLLAEYKKLASNIEKVSLTIAKKTGEDEKIFGTVTSTELEEKLKESGLEVDKRDIHIDEEVKKVGVYNATVKLHAQVDAKLKFWVVADESDA